MCLSHVELELLIFPEHLSSSWFLVAFVLLNIVNFLCSVCSVV